MYNKNVGNNSDGNPKKHITGKSRRDRIKDKNLKINKQNEQKKKPMESTYQWNEPAQTY